MTDDRQRFRRALRGYDRSQVDALCDRIERTLAGTAGSGAVTAEEAANPGLAIRIRGYDPREVEAWIRAKLPVIINDVRGDSTGHR